VLKHTRGAARGAAPLRNCARHPRGTAALPHGGTLGRMTSVPETLSDRVAALEVLLFDLDGTLIDTIDMIMASARFATATVLGEALPDEVLRHNIGVPLVAQMEEYAPGHSAELLAVYREHNARVHDEMIREFPGVEHTLRALSAAGYGMGIVTSKSRPVAQRGLDHFGLGGLFEVLVGYEDTDIHKPDPHPVLEAARRFGVSAEKCLYCGDSPHDMDAGIAAGAVTAAAKWGPFAARVLEPGPDYALEMPDHLVDLLGGNERAYRLAGSARNLARNSAIRRD
jgi:pyrophosphatase PpaX